MSLTQEQSSSKTMRNMLIALCAIMLGTQLPMILSPLGAYIVRDYPNIDPTFAISIVSTPRMFGGLITIVLLAPLMLKANRKILGQLFLVIYIAFAVTFYTVGKMNGPFMAMYGMAFIVGIPAGGYTILCTTIISENYSESKDRLKLIGRYQAFGAAAYMIMLFISGRLASRNDGYAWPDAFLLGILPLIGLVVWSAFLPKETAVTKRSDKEPVKFSWKAFTPGIIMMAALYLLFYCSQNVYNSCVSQWVITERAVGTAADAADATMIGRFVLMGIGLGQPLFVKYLGKWQIPIGGAFTLTACILLYVGQTLPILFLASVCLNIGTGLSNYGVNGYCYEVARPGYGPIAVSVMTMMMMSGGTVTPFLISWFSPVFGGGFNGKLASGILFASLLLVGNILFYTTKNRFRYPNYEKVEITAKDV